MTRSPVLVLGGTGNLGRFVVEELRERGAAVRVLTRTEARARELLGPEVELVVGDLLDPEDRRAAVEGAGGLVLSVSAMTPSTFRRAREIERDAVIACLEQAREVGLRRVVMISIYEIDRALAAELGLAHADIKGDVEDWLARSDMDWTVLGQPPSMDLFFALIRGGRVMAVPGGGPPALPAISSRDTGRIAAEAVLRDDLGGRRFRLAGPDAPSFRQAAERIGAAWGRPLSFVAPPLFLPLALRWLLTPLAGSVDAIGFAHAMIPYLRLLNRFSGTQAAEDFRLLTETFDYEPTTLEDEAARRRPG